MPMDHGRVGRRDLQSTMSKAVTSLIGAGILGAGGYLYATPWISINQFREGVETNAANLFMDASLNDAQLMGRLREVAMHHRVVIIKTPNPLPYSTIYIEFTRGNWTPQQEAAMRDRLARSTPNSAP